MKCLVQCLKQRQLRLLASLQIQVEQNLICQKTLGDNLIQLNYLTDNVIESQGSEVICSKLHSKLRQSRDHINLISPFFQLNLYPLLHIISSRGKTIFKSNTKAFVYFSSSRKGKN